MAYDRQCEGDRAFYARELLRAAGGTPSDGAPFGGTPPFESELLRAVTAHADNIGPDADLYDLYHYTALLGLLYAKGVEDAGGALEGIYARCRDALKVREREPENMIDNELQLYQVMAARLARTMGGGRLPRIYADIAALLYKPKLFNVGDFEEPLSALEQAAQAIDPKTYSLGMDAARVREAYHAWREKIARHGEEIFSKEPKTSAEMLRLVCSGGKISGNYMRLMRDATPCERETLARLALDEADPDRKRSLLLLFSRPFSPWPLDPAPLIDFLQKHENDLTPDPEYHSLNWQLALAVIRVLACVRAEPVREYAFELARGEHRDYAAKLWAVNYRPEDAEAFCEYVKSFPIGAGPDDDNSWHFVQTDALEMFDVKTPGAPVGLLRYIYESSYCALCRSRAVNHMAENGLFDGALLTEWEFDSNSQTRDIALRLKARRDGQDDK